METLDLPVGVVENDVEVRERIEGALRTNCFSPHSLSSVEEVLEFVDAAPHSILIVDLNLGPGRKIAGLDIIERVKSERPGTRICLYSQYVTEGNEYVRRAKRMGVDHVLAKSFNIRSDIEDIMVALGHARAIEHEDVLEEPITIEETAPVKRGRLKVKLTFRGRSVPIPERDPWREIEE